MAQAFHVRLRERERSDFCGDSRGKFMHGLCDFDFVPAGTYASMLAGSGSRERLNIARNDSTKRDGGTIRDPKGRKGRKRRGKLVHKSSIGYEQNKQARPVQSRHPQSRKSKSLHVCAGWSRR